MLSAARSSEPNLTPSWGNVGQVQGFCQNKLEVGDPLTGNLAPPIFNPANGFTYHMRQLAFFSVVLSRW